MVRFTDCELGRVREAQIVFNMPLATVVRLAALGQLPKPMSTAARNAFQCLSLVSYLLKANATLSDLALGDLAELQRLTDSIADVVQLLLDSSL